MAAFDQMMDQVFRDDAAGSEEGQQARLGLQSTGDQPSAQQRDAAFSKSLETQAIANVREKRRRRE